MSFDIGAVIGARYDEYVDELEASLLYNITYETTLLPLMFGGIRNPATPPPPDREQFIREHVAHKAEQRRLDREVGPILGPGRREWRQARRPFENNRAIRATMPGKHPLKFVRHR